MSYQQLGDCGAVVDCANIIVFSFSVQVDKSSTSRRGCERTRMTERVLFSPFPVVCVYFQTFYRN